MIAQDRARVKLKARVSLAQGEPAQAQAHVDEILGCLEAGGLDNVEEPFLIYLTCYRVLRSSDAPRAQAILNTAYTRLQERLAKIPDAEIRRSDLENVVVHREIVAAWQAQQITSNAP